MPGIEFPTYVWFADIACQHGFEIVELHEVRKKRTGTSIVNSTVRVGTVEHKIRLYETAVELRRKRFTAVRWQTLERFIDCFGGSRV